MVPVWRHVTRQRWDRAYGGGALCTVLVGARAVHSARTAGHPGAPALTSVHDMTGRAHVLDAVPGLRELARAQAGMVRRDQLAALGVSAHHVDAQIAARRWREAAPAVIVLTTGWHSSQQRLWLAILNASVPAWLTGLTGLEHRGLSGWHREEIMVLTVKGAHPPRLPRVRYRETRRPPATTPGPVDALPCAPIARCAIEGAGTERGRRTAQGLVIAVVQQGLCTPGDLRRELGETHRIGHRGAIRLALDDAEKGHESLAEGDLARLRARPAWVRCAARPAGSTRTADGGGATSRPTSRTARCW